MPKKPRTSNVRIRLTADERAAIERAAATAGLGPSSFARMTVVKAAGRKPAKPPRRRPDAHMIALARWTGELADVGRNLNQLAKAHNSGGAVDSVRLQELAAEIRQLRESVLRFHDTPPVVE